MTQTTADLREYNNQLEQAHRERVAATLRKNNPLTVHGRARTDRVRADSLKPGDRFKSVTGHQYTFARWYKDRPDTGVLSVVRADGATDMFAGCATVVPVEATP